MHANKTFASAAQLAERFGVDDSTIWRWASKGLLPKPVKFSPGCTRFDLEAVERAIGAHNQKPKQHLRAAAAISVRERKAKRKRARAARSSLHNLDPRLIPLCEAIVALVVDDILKGRR